MDLFDGKFFDYPKPLNLIMHVENMLLKSGDIILDFFSGSATTAHAVFQLNRNDGGNRKFILVQLPEKLDEKTEAYKAGYDNICEIGKERIRRAGVKIKYYITVPSEDRCWGELWKSCEPFSNATVKRMLTVAHQDVGQMDMYIRMYDELKRSDGDNPTIGIVLCADTDDDIARYSVMHGNEQLFASKYKLYLPTEEELKAEIETQKAMFYLQQKESKEEETEE